MGTSVQKHWAWTIKIKKNFITELGKLRRIYHSIMRIKQIYNCIASLDSKLLKDMKYHDEDENNCIANFITELAKVS